MAAKPTTSIEPVKYYFIQSKLNGLVLDVKGGVDNPATPIITYSKKDVASADNQLWYFMGVGNGQYTIHSKLNCMAMDVSRSGGAGTAVITYPTHGSTNQRWSLQVQGTEVFIASALGGNLVVDIRGGNSAPGAEVIVYTKKEFGSDNQQWHFIPATRS